MRKLPALLLLSSLLFPATALASNLSLDPANGTFNRGCPVSINIVLDTQGTQTDGADAILKFDSTRFSGQSVTQGSIYPDFPGNNIDNATGRVTISGLASVSTPFAGRGVLATVNFSVKDAAPTGAAQINFDFNPQRKDLTTDSNVVERETVADTLNSVVDGAYKIGSGSCSSQTTPGTSTGTGTGTGTGTTTTGSVVTAPSTYGATRQGTTFVATPSADKPAYVPIKTLPEGGTKELTFTLAIVGGVLTILGILGLALL